MNFLILLLFTFLFNFSFCSNQNPEQQNITTENVDKLSRFCDDILGKILVFLDQKSSGQFRLGSRKLLRIHLDAMNREFLYGFRQRITAGCDTLMTNNRLASTVLMPFKDRLSSLLDPESVKELISKSVIVSTLNEDELKELLEITEKLAVVTNFEPFIKMAFYFFYQTYPIVFWRLVDTVLRAKICKFHDFFYIPQFNPQTAFIAACELNLKHLARLVLESHYTGLNLRNGAVACMRKNHRKIFINIIRVSLIIDPNPDVFMNLLLESAVMDINYDYIQHLFKLYSRLSSEPSQAVFIAISKRDTTCLSLILKHRGANDLIGIFDEFGRNAFEAAASKDFWQGIVMMTQFLAYDGGIETYLKALKIAIFFESVMSVSSLITEINHIFGPFDEIVSRDLILRFLVNAIEVKNVTILDLLLTNSPRDILELRNTDNAYNPIYYIIKNSFVEGLYCIMTRFTGQYVMNLRDHTGKTPFLIAAACGNSVMARIISITAPSQINSFDNDGNNALQVAVMHLKTPMNFINSVLDLNFDWDHQNSDGLSPIDMLTELPSLTSDDLSNIYYIYMQSQTLKDK